MPLSVNEQAVVDDLAARVAELEYHTGLKEKPAPPAPPEPQTVAAADPALAALLKQLLTKLGG